MGKTPVRLREVVYTLSPFQQTVMSGLFKDVPQKIHRKIAEVCPIEYIRTYTSQVFFWPE